MRAAVVCPTLPWDSQVPARCWRGAWSRPANRIPGQKCYQSILTPPAVTSVSRRDWTGQSRMILWGRSCLQVADNIPFPCHIHLAIALGVSCFGSVGFLCLFVWVFLMLFFYQFTTALLPVPVLWRCPWPGDGRFPQSMGESWAVVWVSWHMQPHLYLMASKALVSWRISEHVYHLLSHPTP